jgi:ribosome assembly protein YihI (activator of Der GTPase)
LAKRTRAKHAKFLKRQRAKFSRRNRKRKKHKKAIQPGKIAKKTDEKATKKVAQQKMPKIEMKNAENFYQTPK